MHKRSIKKKAYCGEEDKKVTDLQPDPAQEVCALNCKGCAGSIIFTSEKECFSNVYQFKLFVMKKKKKNPSDRCPSLHRTLKKNLKIDQDLAHIRSNEIIRRFGVAWKKKRVIATDDPRNIGYGGRDNGTAAAAAASWASTVNDARKEAAVVGITRSRSRRGRWFYKLCLFNRSSVVFAIV